MEIFNGMFALKRNPLFHSLASCLLLRSRGGAGTSMAGKEYHCTDSNYWDPCWLIHEDPQSPQDPFKEGGTQTPNRQDTADCKEFFRYFIFYIGSNELLLLIHCVKGFSVSLMIIHKNNNLLRTKKIGVLGQAMPLFTHCLLFLQLASETRWWNLSWWPHNCGHSIRGTDF